MLSTGMNVEDGKTAISCLSFVADFQNMIHEGGKVSVLYFDATETELQKKIRSFNLCMKLTGKYDSKNALQHRV